VLTYRIYEYGFKIITLIREFNNRVVDVADLLHTTAYHGQRILSHQKISGLALEMIYYLK
jgi:hypothetical protein